ncbi:PHP domain-containing protein [Flammeovirgaceae bacterium SG7u.111]|nr:PHP domain-containing protein [Flammeovirgaceae bacterium SG7u.132]WPO35769.1 PHP domain-containing protein [Flammeovirgaceae bacterium SG7u.111]
MSNKEIIKLFKLTASLLELHDANPFKVRGYTGFVFNMEKTTLSLYSDDTEKLKEAGVSKGMLVKIEEIRETGSFKELDELLETTPAGVIKMLDIKGIGAKKIKTIWKELGVESLEALIEACKNDQISALKGFGKKTQELIIEQIEFIDSNVGKLLFAKAEPFALELEKYLKEKLPNTPVFISGQLRRAMEIIDKLELLVSTENTDAVWEAMADVPEIVYHEAESSPFTWRGEIEENKLKVEVKVIQPEKAASQLFIDSSDPFHLAFITAEGKSLRSIAIENSFETEEAIYKKAGLGYVQPEMREGDFELDLAKENKLPELLTLEDLKGSLHNHSNYSDGKNTLEEMATYCRDMGYEYLGISDHSKSAFYANGLDESRIIAQHKEIDELNEKLAPFKIFKGIESDILNDGNLDYDNEVLASFDFIVASIHSNLKMDKQKATDRLLKAIANPYTTTLGHPTGRLLLKREGYPIDHKAVIDACAAANVSIEINANPLRLDLDWRWVRYALDQNVMISINPDAHETAGYHDMRYGVLVGRKAGLTKEMTLNAMSAEELEEVFRKKREGK